MSIIFNKINNMKKKLKGLSLLIALLMMSLSFINAQEICNNGIDDDGDGLIDLYDSDCQTVADTSNFFFNKSIPFCSSKPPVYYTWTLEEKFNTNEANGGSLSGTPPYPIDQRCGLFVGDLDGDGVSELISKDGSAGSGTGAVRVFNGINGKILQSFSESSHAYTQVAIANIDDDNTGDIFLINNSAYLVRLQYNGPSSAITRVWTSAAPVASNQQSPQIADFDQDGTPEVYVGNYIFNSTDGTLLVHGTANSGSLRLNDTWPIAYDIYKQGDLDPDGSGTFDTDANGLELVAGNQVFLVANNAGTWSMTKAAELITSSITNTNNADVLYGDGFTSLGDLNGDKRPDIIVTTSAAGANYAYIYAYDPITLNQIGATAYLIHTDKKQAGRCNVADFDGDGQLEIGTAGHNLYVVLETDLTKKWEKTGLQDGSSQTGSTVFDFEGDGSAEVVYSDETTLYVWKGADGRQLASIASASGTRTDYPIVADVDDDGQAEIVITSQYAPGPSVSDGMSWISVYRSADAPWVAARETWNQHGYFVTNTNNDLTVPRVQQDFVSPVFNYDFNTAFNQFLVQTTYLTYEAQPTFATGDLTTENVEFDLASCPVTHEINFTLTLENNGSWKIPRGTPISYYDGDPYLPGSVYLDSLHLPVNILPGESYTISDKVIDENEDGKMDLYVLANHSNYTVDGTPLSLPLVKGTINSPTLECDYANNLGFIVSIDNCVAASAPEIDLDRNNSSGKTGNDYEIGFAVGEATTFNVSDNDVFIRDTDSPDHIMGAVITLTNLIDVGDETLGISTTGQDYADQYGITVSVTSNVVTLSGLGNTLLEYEKVIKNITYKNSNATPDMTERVITFEVQDGNLINDPLAETHIVYTIRPTIDLDLDNSSLATGSDYQAIFTEGDAGIKFVDDDIEFADADGTTLSEAIVTLTNKTDGTLEDIKVPFSLPSGILRDFDELTPGKVRLYGEASFAEYMSAISSLTYVNTNEDPTAGDRIIEVVINDGYLDSKTATATITVVPVNDNPVISGSTEAVIYTTGNEIVLPYPAITDVDNTKMKSATITITTNFISGEDVLSFTPDYGVTGSFDSGTGILTLTGEATIQEYEALISTIEISATLGTNTDNKAVSIKVTDKDGGESNVFHKTVILINDAGNDAPYAADDSYEVFKSNTVIKTAPGVLSNDVDPDDDGITVDNPRTITGSLNGSLTLNSDGSFTYDPDETNAAISPLVYGQSVNETFQYQIIDDGTVEPGSVLSNTADILFTIKGENAIPVANDDSYSVDQDAKLIISSPGILNNDTDADGVSGLKVVQVASSYSSVVYGQYGTLDWYGDGSFVYTPNQSNPDVRALQVGDPDLVETFTYAIEDPNHGSDEGTVTINIKGTNDPPHVYAEKISDITNKNASLTFNDANNNKIYIADNDGDDQEVTITVTDGTLTLSGSTGLSFSTGTGTADASMVFTGTIANINTALDGATFNPTTDFTGTAVFVVATDDQQVGTPAETEDDETINILVIDPNTAPVVTLPASHTIDEDQSISYSGGAMSIADADGDDQTVTITISNGILTLSGITGLTGLTGNGTSNITFSGSLTDINSALDGAVFSPSPNYSGPASVQLFSKDNKGGTDVKTDNITINYVNKVPVAVNDVKTILEDNAPVIIYAIVNDEDPDGNGISIDGTYTVIDTDNGTLVDNSDGTFTYTPKADSNGSDSYSYNIIDGNGDNSVSDATITINITAVNDVPSFTKGSDQTIDENTTGIQTINSWATSLSPGPADESAQTLSFNVTNNNNSMFATQPAIDASGNLTYELAADQYGSATVTVSISDDGGTANGGNDTSADQTFAIIVNPIPQVSLSVDNATIAEAAGVATFTATLNHTSTQAVTVNLTYSGTATLSGTDANAAAGTNASDAATIVIPAGSTTGTVTVTAVDDAIFEGGETVVVDIASVTNGTEATAQQATTTITDDDSAPSVTLAVDNATIVENGGVATFTATLSNTSTQAVTVNLTYSGTATLSGTDANAAAGTNASDAATIVIPAGSTTGTVTVTAVDDAIVEGGETVVVDIASVTNGTEATAQQATTTITDDEALPTVSLSVSRATIVENGGTSNLTATLSNTSAVDVVVTIGYTGTAANGTDYTGTTTITIPAGNLSASITLTGTDDAITEGNETIIADITDVTNATEDGTQQETVTVTDDEALPTVSLSVSQATIAENGGTSNLTATLSNASSQDVDVTITYTGTATNGTDYTGTTTITIPAGSLSASITLTGTDDAITEGNETIIADITAVTNATENGTQQETVTITDDEGTPTVTLSASQATIAENGGTSNLTATLSNTSAVDVVVTIGYTGTAANGTDYTGTTTITIPAGNLSASITLTGTDDAITEGNETIIADITDVTNATEDGTQQETVTVTDDDFADSIPVAIDDVVSVDEDGTLNGNVSTNDTGLEDTPVTYTLTNDVSNGTLTLNSDGTYTYIPDGDFNGTDSFTYTVCDADGDCSTATVTITVNPINDGPIAVNDTTNISGTGDISVLDNDLDPDGDILTLTILTNPQEGTATVDNGVITYTASSDYCGIDSIEYQICDLEPQCATAWVIINIHPADTDGDGIPDSEETLTADTDNDGIMDYMDLDSDNDGIPDQIEAHTDGDACNYEPFDFDEDGTPDYLDIDSDDDGIMDIIEDGGTDNDNDGQIDGFIDNNNDGADDDHMTNGDVDTDNDGSPDYNDLDSDNDGLSDEEEGFVDDCDGDGILNFQDPDECIVDLFVPEGFSPNNDGINDYFVIRGIENYPNNKIKILNRWGNTVFETIGYSNDWDGRNTKGVSVGNDELPEGTYFYILELGESNKVVKGYIYLKR